MKVDVLLGLQWGDEGKGKIVDVLTPQYDVIARFQGGPNAGHTLTFDGKKLVLHTIPSGIFRRESVNVIGNGVIIDPYILVCKEIESIKQLTDVQSKLYISDKAHLILPTHRLLDYANELSRGVQKIGSTLKGIGPTYTDKVARNGVRIGNLLTDNFRARYENLRKIHIRIIENMGLNPEEISIDGMSFRTYEEAWFEAVETLKSYRICSTEYLLNNALASGKSVLAEGAQGSLLDVDFGSYPFVTSSNTLTSGVCAGLGVAPTKIGKVIGLFKAYCTRVGEGPFPTELLEHTGELLREKGNEFGSTTGRPRRCGWLDLPQLKYACMLNGVSELVMMKADVLEGFEEIKLCTSYKFKGRTVDEIPFDALSEVEPEYTTVQGWQAFSQTEELPQTLKEYIARIENYLDLKIKLVSVGPDRTQNIFL